MSLIALGVIGRHGTPLYLRDYADDAPLLFNLYAQTPGDAAEEDAFGGDGLPPLATETTAEQRAAWPCRLQHQFALHSAHTRLDDVLRDGRWKAPGATGMDACWVGLLCLADNLRAYGYVTTNARYLALVEDAIAPENVPLQTTRDNEICVLMAHVHRLFTESLLNPFATPQSPIASPRFDAGVTKLVRGLNEG